MKRIFMCFASVICVYLSLILNINAENRGKPPIEVGKAIISASDHIDAGEYQVAIDRLTPIIYKYEAYKQLYLLRGRAYFSLKPAKLDEAEEDFNQAVVIDAKDEEAKALVAKIREARKAQVSENLLEILGYVKSFIFEVLLIAFGFAGGFLINNYIKALLDRIKSNKLIKDKKYEQFISLLESKVKNTDYEFVRNRLCSIDGNYLPPDRLGALIDDYVVVDEYKKILKKMLERIPQTK